MKLQFSAFKNAKLTEKIGLQESLIKVRKLLEIKFRLPYTIAKDPLKESKQRDGSQNTLGYVSWTDVLFQ